MSGKPAVHVSHGVPPDQPHASTAVFEGSLDRLTVDMERSIKQMNWSMLRIKINNGQFIDDSIKTGGFCIGEPPYVEAWALMPSGTTAHIHGSLNHFDKNNPQGLVVTIQVGDFGHPEAQARYLHRLQRILKGKPLPKRGQTFEMPPLEKYQQAHEPRYETQ